jgi:O-6-methylguanine DNA methyltransferase
MIQGKKMIKISVEDQKYKLTGFQWKVLSAVMSIPLGETRSYQWVAERIGHPKAVRAVGTALRKNPFPLIIPCHRVVRSDGTPGLYCGRSDGVKEKLLRLEQAILKNVKK